MKQTTKYILLLLFSVIFLNSCSVMKQDRKIGENKETVKRIQQNSNTDKTLKIKDNVQGYNNQETIAKHSKVIQKQEIESSTNINEIKLEDKSKHPSNPSEAWIINDSLKYPVPWYEKMDTIPEDIFFN
jgi:hypothetical protein